MSPSTGFLYHPVFLKHQTGWAHPEKRQRLTALLKHLQATGLWDRLVHLDPEPASESDITRVHDPAYVESLRRSCEGGQLFKPDDTTVASPGTYEAARMAAGAVTRALGAVMAGEISNAFCAIRPPGHHAERDHAMGFCFFNNIAIGARYLRQHFGLGRIAIIDWDVHHGNGTQQAFYEDPSVFYFSILQFPLYPFTSGRACETGAGPGRGFNLNVPVAAGATDSDYRRIVHDDLRPAMARFKPEFILVSAGFDGHRRDPLGGLALTEAGFGEMTRAVMALAAEHAQGRLVSVLEGGYDLEALCRSCEAHLRAMMESPQESRSR